MRRLRALRRDRGQVAVEFVGFLPLLLLLGVAAVQLGLVGYAAQQSGTAARVAARTASVDDRWTPYDQAGRDSISGWLADGTRFERTDGLDDVTVTARVRIPSIIPGVDDFGDATRDATMPRD